MKNLKWLLIIFVILSFVQFSDAKCRQRAKIKYKTSSGWSKYYDVEVTFVSGKELNTATNSYSYQGPAYAVIFWEQNEATVIELDMLYPGVEISCDFINGLFELKGKDQDGDYWKICTGDFCN